MAARTDIPQVVIVMDRGAADYLRLVGNDHNSPEFFSDCYQGEVMPAVRAALDRDQDELETRIAKAICGRDRGREAWSWEGYKPQARAVLHALQEGTE